MAERDELLAALQERMVRAGEGDRSLLLAPDGPAEARRLAEMLGTAGRADGDTEAWYVLGWWHWFRYQVVPAGENRQDLTVSVAMFTRCFVAGVPDDRFPEPMLPVAAEQAAGTDGIALLQRALGSADLDLLEIAVRLWQRIVATIPADHPDLAGFLSNLGVALSVRYGRSGNLADLEESITAGRRAIQATPGDHPDLAGHLGNLGIALRVRFERAGDLADLEEAIVVGRQAVQATSADHPDPVVYLGNLGIALRVRFERTGNLADLEEAIAAGRHSIQATSADHPDLAGRLANLGTALRARYERSGNLAEEKAITAVRQAIQLTPADHPDQAAILGNLGNALSVRFERTGNVADLEAAIIAGRQAVEATPADHPERLKRLGNLGTALLTQFGRTGNLADLDETISAVRQATQETPADHPDLAGCLNNLGAALSTRFGRVGNVADLDEAIAAGREAIQASPADQAKRLANLGIALLTRFGRSGNLADLDEAIAAGRQAIQASPADHPDHAVILSNLGAALRTRFGRNGGLADLEEAIAAGRQAVQATPVDHPDRAGRLANLGIALRARFERVRNEADLDEAIAAGRQAIQASPPDHPDRRIIHNNLGIALSYRFEQTGNLADLDEAIAAGRQAIQASPADHPDQAGMLGNLATALSVRFGRSGNVADLDEAIIAGRQAIQATPADHPQRAGRLNNLGNALSGRFERTGGQADLAAAVEVYAQAVGIAAAPPSWRIRAARKAARLSATSDPIGAARLLEQAVLLLPEISPRQLERTDQQHMIGQFAGLASEAAALALNDLSVAAGDRAGRALRLLEAGRAVLLSQTLHTRSDLTDLRARHPHLADQFIALRDLLDQPTPAESSTSAAALAEPVSVSSPTEDLRQAGDATPRRASAGEATRWQEESDRHRAAAEMAALLRQIRALEGFNSFALPPTLDQLRAQADAGPVVTFNISDLRSDALLLTSDGVTSLSLPDLNQEMLIDQVTAFHESLADGTDSGQDTEAAQNRVREVLAWLWDVAAGPVLTALGYHQPPPPSMDPMEWLRVWWAPGGLLGLLPIHAAGYHTPGPDPEHRAVMDRVVSSYIPTITALRHTRQYADRQYADRRDFDRQDVDRRDADRQDVDRRDVDRRCADRPDVSQHDDCQDVSQDVDREARQDVEGRQSTVVVERALIVAMPVTPGLRYLPQVRREAALVAAHLPGAIQLTRQSVGTNAPSTNAAPSTGAPGEGSGALSAAAASLAADGAVQALPTRANVMAHLPDCTIAHFACHGISDPADPSNSRLLLQDHRHNPLTVASLIPINLEHARLVYLSACSTALNWEVRLLDEAIHLTSAFQMAGFPHVIGTLWAISDD
ncbi:CHAT domain-containing protein [Acrocarpospora macrocephala]|uniref:CHAT domain-containing protein n=1 Tax=Acrocarpospora macrocephala TaxID=150177 RepID=A0A5M3X369_9ACTN|nr:tetratricopeptide repeat protein [Acrocarpospora macrocephala]GES16187.1 CHAT domain-containing protein [Acrocarpospora macrocephala]